MSIVAYAAPRPGGCDVPQERSCPAPVTHRYRMDESEAWGRRCAVHAEWLQAPGLTIERV